MPLELVGNRSNDRWNVLRPSGTSAYICIVYWKALIMNLKAKWRMNEHRNWHKFLCTQTNKCIFIIALVWICRFLFVCLGMNNHTIDAYIHSQILQIQMDYWKCHKMKNLATFSRSNDSKSKFYFKLCASVKFYAGTRKNIYYLPNPLAFLRCFSVNSKSNYDLQSKTKPNCFCQKYW